MNTSDCHLLPNGHLGETVMWRVFASYPIYPKNIPGEAATSHRQNCLSHSLPVPIKRAMHSTHSVKDTHEQIYPELHSWKLNAIKKNQ